MKVRLKEKFLEGMIIGLTTSIMIIFITFLWNKALAVDTVILNVETKLQEVVNALNESNQVLLDRINRLEGDSQPILNETLQPTPIVDIIETQSEYPPPQMIQQMVPQLEGYNKSWR